MDVPNGRGHDALGGPVDHLVDPSEGLAEHVRFLFNFLDLAAPNVGTVVVPAFARTRTKSFSQCDALLQRPQGAAERASKVLVDSEIYHIRPMGVTDMATIVGCVVVDLPHHAIAIGTRQHRTPTSRSMSLMLAF
jgi:hypothetical protein